MAKRKSKASHGKDVLDELLKAAASKSVGFLGWARGIMGWIHCILVRLS
jgi:hypothetical protein